MLKSKNYCISKEFAGNQQKYQNWVPSILSHNLRLILMGMKRKKNLFCQKKKNQNGRHKKLRFSKPPILNIFAISGIGPWLSTLNWCEGHWCCSTYMVVMLSDVTSKTGKNHQKCNSRYLIFVLYYLLSLFVYCLICDKKLSFKRHVCLSIRSLRNRSAKSDN